jgi:hypothetical protein
MWCTAVLPSLPVSRTPAVPLRTLKCSSAPLTNTAAYRRSQVCFDTLRASAGASAASGAITLAASVREYASFEAPRPQQPPGSTQGSARSGPPAGGTGSTATRSGTHSASPDRPKSSCNPRPLTCVLRAPPSQASPAGHLFKFEGCELHVMAVAAAAAAAAH